MSLLTASQPGAMSSSDSWLFLGFLAYSFVLIGLCVWDVRRKRARRRPPRHVPDTTVGGRHE